MWKISKLKLLYIRITLKEFFIYPSYRNMYKSIHVMYNSLNKFLVTLKPYKKEMHKTFLNSLEIFIFIIEIFKIFFKKYYINHNTYIVSYICSLNVIDNILQKLLLVFNLKNFCRLNFFSLH